MTEKDKILHPRREFLLESIKISGKRGLEIGPLASPLITKADLKDDGGIFYLDHLSEDELKEKYRSDKSIKIDEILPVDFICPDGDILKAVDECRFDYIVASHVIEHSPNMLKFLADLYEILLPGGVLFLVIPDMRFTFDKNRAETTFGELLEKFLLNAKWPSIAAVYDHFAMASNANGHNLWHGIINKEDSELLVSEDFAWEAAHRVYNEKLYFDVHVNVFKPASFFGILKKALLHNLVQFQVDRFQDTAIGQIEFMVVLKKTIDNEQINAKAECMQSIPYFGLDSLLSPYMPQVKALSEALQTSTKISENLHKEINELQDRISNRENSLNKLRADLNLARAILNRKSVRMALTLVDRSYNFFKVRERKQKR